MPLTVETTNFTPPDAVPEPGWYTSRSGTLWYWPETEDLPMYIPECQDLTNNGVIVWMGGSDGMSVEARRELAVSSCGPFTPVSSFVLRYERD